MRLISIGCILLFAILPLLTLAFHITGADWQYILKDSSFREAVTNSLIYTTVSAAVTTVLALAAAADLSQQKAVGFFKKHVRR